LELLLTLLLFVATLPVPAATQRDAADNARAIVPLIQRADYRDDRAALKLLVTDLAPYRDDRQIGTRVLYWRGFALWRRALNGFNDGVDKAEIEQDLRGAVAEFQAAYTRNPNFADAKLAAASCLMNLLYIHLNEPGAVNQYSAKFKPLIKDAETVAPENPRLLWVIGAGKWYMPASAGGGSAAAIETYGRGIESVHRQKKSSDPLDPSWGEPELLMNLAWSNLHKAQPDVDAAEQYARAALKIVPDWHYVRDILLPQITEAKAKATSNTN
jgi:hypothetical protein